MSHLISSTAPSVISFEVWNRLMKSNVVKDLSKELKDGFLMYGQLMRAKIRIEDTVYYATAWITGDVYLTPITKE